MSTPLLTGCTCGKLSMAWAWRGGRWQGRCKLDDPPVHGAPGACGATSWASTGEALRLDERAEDIARG